MATRMHISIASYLCTQAMYFTYTRDYCGQSVHEVQEAHRLTAALRLPAGRAALEVPEDCQQSSPHVGTLQAETHPQVAITQRRGIAAGPAPVAKRDAAAGVGGL